MHASERLWRQWSSQLRACRPELHAHRSKTLAFFVWGIMVAGTARLPRVAEALVGSSAAKTPRSERRLARLLAHEQSAVLPLWTHLRSRGADGAHVGAVGGRREAQRNSEGTAPVGTGLSVRGRDVYSGLLTVKSHRPGLVLEAGT